MTCRRKHCLCQRLDTMALRFYAMTSGASLAELEYRIERQIALIEMQERGEE